MHGVVHQAGRRDAAARDRSVLWGVVDVRPVEQLDGAIGVPIPVIA